MTTEFIAYGPSHLVMLALLAAACGGLVVVGRRARGGPRALIVRRRLAAVVALTVLPFQLWTLLPGRWDVAKSLPFELCDLAWLASIVALWSGGPWACGLLYYWGLTLTTQAVLTPRLSVDFPSYEFAMFWSEHLLVVLAAVFMTWGAGYRPGWPALARTAAVTLAWGGLMLVFNTAAGTNYMFVNHKPETASAFDVMGPWPLYLATSFSAALALWALITVPWELAGRRAAGPGPGG